MNQYWPLILRQKCNTHSIQLGRADLCTASIKEPPLTCQHAFLQMKKDRHLRSKCEEFPIYLNVNNHNSLYSYFVTWFSGQLIQDFRGNYSKSNCRISPWGSLKIPSKNALLFFLSSNPRAAASRSCFLFDNSSLLKNVCKHFG